MIFITPITQKRDWKKINNRLVRQGTLLISLSFLETWKEKVKQLNKNKVGRPFEYPTGLIEYAGALHCFMHLGYRQVKGVLMAVAKKEPKLKPADYSTLNRRFNKLETKIQPRIKPAEDLWIAVDASGVSVTNRGEWMRKIHRKGKIEECKGFLKIHVAVDVNTKELVAIEVTRENVGDNTMLKPLLIQTVKNTNRNIVRLMADGAYDTYENFEMCQEAGIEPAISIDDNAATHPPPDTFLRRRRKEPLARYTHASEQLKDKDKWKKEKKYGLRWQAEGFFSVLKRRYGKHVMAKHLENMQQELFFKAQLYNQLL